MSDEITANRKADALELIEDLINWCEEFSHNIMKPDDLSDPPFTPASRDAEILVDHLEYLGLLRIASGIKGLSEWVFQWYCDLALSHPMYGLPNSVPFGSRKALLARLREWVFQMAKWLLEARGILDPSTKGGIELPKDPPALSQNAQHVYEFLLSREPYEAVSIKMILDHLMSTYRVNMDESTLRQRVMPELKAYGLEHRKRKGYRIPESRRPSAQ